jgi:glycosyltransferase involved in cell wall biosynthesis
LIKVSIITVTYNSAQYLEDCILSVINQTYNNIEYIIIDGKSTDNTVSIIKKYASQLHYWISEKDNGQSDAINIGLRRATGSIFNWLNSDDYYEPGALHAMADGFSREPEKKIIPITKKLPDHSMAFFL